MEKIESVTYEQARLHFFEEQLAHAKRQLKWAIKHNHDCYVCAEKVEIVSFFQDVINLLKIGENK